MSVLQRKLRNCWRLGAVTADCVAISRVDVLALVWLMMQSEASSRLQLGGCVTMTSFSEWSDEECVGDNERTVSTSLRDDDNSSLNHQCSSLTIMAAFY